MAIGLAIVPTPLKKIKIGVLRVLRLVIWLVIVLLIPPPNVLNV